MKTFVNKKTIKKLIIIICIITMLSPLVPISVQAKTDTEDGGGILYPIENFLLFLSDKVMEWLQHTFVSPESIEIEEDVWDFKYSPAIIFSGDVPALDINFITPGEGKTASTTSTEYMSLKRALELNGAKKIKETMLGMINDIKQEPQYEYDKNREIDISTLKGKTSSSQQVEPTFDVTKNKLECVWYNSNKTKIYVVLYYEHKIDEWNEGLILYEMDSLEALNKATQITDTYTEIEGGTKEYKSTAALLQNTIATWYNALRRIALVGLLSVLVYVGIRMVMTSSAGDKAKYKAMAKDWLVAICILFTLHYIMSITITVTNEISNIFQPGESDVLLNTLRQEIFSTGDRAIVLAKTIMYVVLVILTVTFTIQYVKRVVYMAFYTLIAPLITLTYPLDKIKDGQAQAFSMWIKEYLYTALTQVIHLVIYTVLVGSALDLVSSYPLYAIIVLAFIKKADGIIKKMFGFDKSETVGTLGAAATGALVMNAINKLSRKRWFKRKRRSFKRKRRSIKF